MISLTRPWLIPVAANRLNGTIPVFLLTELGRTA